MQPNVLVALPVFNEEAHVAHVLRRVQQFNSRILVVDDGSTDATGEILNGFSTVEVVTHPKNRGYGAALQSAFEYAIGHDFDVLVTIDCDGQHQPELIPALAAAIGESVDMVSGSRYLKPLNGETPPPEDRRRINATITREINQQLGLSLTDAFCGFKAYRVSSLRELEITESGYAMPLQLWVQAAALGLSIQEFPVPLVYFDEDRSFGGALDDAEYRLKHYRDILGTEMRKQAAAAESFELDRHAESATCSDTASCPPCGVS